MCCVRRRQVDSKDGETLAREMDCAWIETSAKNNINIGLSFVFFFLSEWLAKPLSSPL
jgi:hypothetical protein